METQIIVYKRRILNSQGNSILHKMSSSYSEHCCRKPPVENNYKPKGVLVNLRENLPVYVIGPENATKAVFVFYDIHGFQ